MSREGLEKRYFGDLRIQQGFFIKGFKLFWGLGLDSDNVQSILLFSNTAGYKKKKERISCIFDKWQMDSFKRVL